MEKLKSECIYLAEEYRQRKEKPQKVIHAHTEEEVKNKFDIVDYTKEGSESEEGTRTSMDVLTPSTDAKLQKFFTAIQQEDQHDTSKDEHEDDLDDYISKLESHGS